MKRFVVLIVSLPLLMHCSGPKDDQPVEISYFMKDIRLESQGGCAADTMQCAYYAVQYPEFSGLDSAVSKKLQQRFDESVAMGNPEASGRSMHEIGAGFVQDFDDFKAEMPDLVSGWYYSAIVNVEVLTDSLISLSVDEEYYTGGAHGGHGTYFINVVPGTGETFTLDAFLRDGFEEPLRALGEKAFRDVHSIPDTASLQDNYFEFPDDRFQLNQNYGFRKEGIAFFYNNYEIAPYAAGPTEVLIPYEALEEWIR
jgi:hypothetical protein